MAILTPLVLALKWWVERRDARSQLVADRDAALKTVTTLERTIRTLRADVEQYQRDCALWQQRALWAESRRSGDGSGVLDRDDPPA